MSQPFLLSIFISFIFISIIFVVLLLLLLISLLSYYLNIIILSSFLSFIVHFSPFSFIWFIFLIIFYFFFFFFCVILLFWYIFSCYISYMQIKSFHFVSMPVPSIFFISTNNFRVTTRLCGLFGGAEPSQNTVFESRYSDWKILFCQAQPQFQLQLGWVGLSFWFS